MGCDPGRPQPLFQSSCRTDGGGAPNRTALRRISIMKKSISVFLATALLAIVTTRAMAHESHGAGHGMGAHMGAAGARRTITGEVVDTGCYIAHSARGEKHVSCATKCINQGMPMGLLTSDGTLYLVTLNHDNADPYNH